MAKEEEAPADGGGEGGEASAEPKRRALSGKKLILFVVAPAAVVLLAVTVTLVLLLSGGKEEEVKHEEPPPPAVKPLVYYNLPEILVNLNATGRRSSFLKMTVSLELADPADVQRVQAVMPRIIDNMQAYLRELRAEDLKGSAGLFRLREEMLARVNAAAAPAKVIDVLFQEVLVQ